MQRLRSAGFAQEQTEAITHSIHSGVTGGVATRTDLERVEGDLTAKIETVHSNLTAKIERVEGALREEISVIRTDLRWIKLIGGGILAVLVLPWLSKLAEAVLN